MSDSFVQIFLSNTNESLPAQLREHADSFKRLYSHCNYTLFSISTLREWIVNNMDNEIVAAYDGFKPLAYKADLARYCLIYKLGGWYADISLKPCIGMRLSSDVDIAYFYDFGSGIPSPFRSSHDVMNAFFYSRAGNPILLKTIESIIHNFQNRYYGITSLCPTGPTLFGRAIAQFAPNPSMLMGHFMPLTPSHTHKNKAFVAQDGSIIAWHKSAWHPSSPSGGDISVFGVTGSNNHQNLC